jgi:predicted DCC family thiol-disulfide oxidoreductase YuxK
MIVFSSSARILHMNGPARALMALFGTSHELWPQMAPESMPSILTEFCYDVLAQLQRRIEAQDWTQFEMRRICHTLPLSHRVRCAEFNQR